MFLIFTNVNAQTFTIGNGTINQNGTGWTPYGTFYEDGKVQYLILKSELNSQGFNGGTITSLAFDCITVPGQVINGFTIRLAHTNVTNLSTEVVGTFTPNVSINSHTPVVGWNTYTFTSNFTYNNTDNLLVEVCFDNASWTSNGGVNSTTTGFVSIFGRFQDGGAGCTTAPTNITTNSNRPNMRFTASSGSSGPTLPPIANFYPSLPNVTTTPLDTIWLGSPYTLVSTSQNASRTYWDLPNVTNLPTGYFRQSLPFTTQQYIDTLKYDRTFRYTFNQRGFHPVRLLAVNYLKADSLRDSVLRYVFVDTPSQVPNTDFITFKRKIGFGDYGNLLDLTRYGPNQWLWTFDPPCNKCNQLPFFNNFFAGPTDQNPLFFGGDPGKYTICLQTWNARGWDSICKPSYIEVLNSYSICSGSGATFTSDKEGYLFGPSGPGLSYTRSQLTGCTGIVVAPCADSITFYVERIKMLPTDSLEFRNGTTPSAPLIARIGGNNLNAIPLQFRNGIRLGRFAHVRIVPGTGTVPNPYDSAGFNIRWDIQPPTYSKPTARMDIPDTVYSNQPSTYRSTAIGTLINHAWDSDGNNQYDSSTGQFSRTFFITTPQVRNICYVAFNCVGSDTVCKAVVFLPTTQKPVARITVDKAQGFNIDTFYFRDRSLNGPATWRWTFTPGSVQFLNGTTQNTQNPNVRFTQRTRYTVKLVVTNAIGSDSITEVNYVNIGAYDIPYSITPINQADGSIGISRVILQTGIDTTTNALTPDYQYIQGLQLGLMYRGKKHALTATRPGITAAMDRKAWIDFNMDGNFDNAEQVMNELGGTTLSRTDSVLVPINQRLGTTRMRVGVTLANTTLNPALAYLGVFRDYNVNFPMDTVKPIIALNGAANLNTEINKPYVEPGVTAIDNIEGDISSRYEVYGTVNTSQVGPNLLKYIVRDLYGNISDTAYRTVFVVLNQTGPTLTLNGPSIQYVEVYNKFNELGWTAVDNQNNNISNQVVVSGSVDTSLLGSYTLRYRVTDAYGISVVVNRQVNVGDTTRPVITPKYTGNNNYYEHQIGQLFNFMNAVTIKDNYWPLQNLDIEWFGVVDANSPGTYFVRYRARDPRGNIANEVTVTIVVVDRVAPTIILNGLSNIDVDVFTAFTDPGITTSDNYWPLNTLLIETKGVVNLSKLGSYVRKYIVTDPSGNKDSVSRIINVVDRTKPSIVVIGDNPYNLQRWKEFVDPGVSINDNYYSESELLPLLITDNNLPLNTSGKPFGDYPGLFVVKYQVSDLVGNSSTTAERIINVQQEGSTGIANVLNFANFVSAYPNPAKNILNISLVKTTYDEVSLKIYDIQGKALINNKIKNASTNIQQINIAELQPGVYLLQIIIGAKSYTQKLVVE